MTHNSSKQLIASPGQPLNMLLQANRVALYVHYLANLIQKLGCGLVHFLSGGSDLIITQYNQGNIHTWQVYDSLTDKTLYFEHQEALHIWIEQHYNQQ
ncbi:MAG: hypothetical protein F6K11_05965 [Leptolyngbya sp. SIO3F4]|nr:hypothetical protein [Leptolyngbya sp. SIO3F4]